MSVVRHNDQMNVRAPSHVLEALRRERDRRGLTLGDTVEALLELAAHDRREEGLKFSLPPHVLPALKAAAAAVGTDPQGLLQDLLEGVVRERLLVLASRLSAPAVGPAPVPSASPSAPVGQDRARLRRGDPQPPPLGGLGSGGQLRRYRLDNGLSQRGLADALIKPGGKSYTQQSVALLERRDASLSRGFMAAFEAAVDGGRLPPPS